MPAKKPLSEHSKRQGSSIKEKLVERYGQAKAEKELEFRVASLRKKLLANKHSLKIPLTKQVKASRKPEQNVFENLQTGFERARARERLQDYHYSLNELRGLSKLLHEAENKIKEQKEKDELAEKRVELIREITKKPAVTQARAWQIGRASCRERV